MAFDSLHVDPRLNPRPDALLRGGLGLLLLPLGSWSLPRACRNMIESCSSYSKIDAPLKPSTRTARPMYVALVPEIGTAPSGYTPAFSNSNFARTHNAQRIRSYGSVGPLGESELPR